MKRISAILLLLCLSLNLWACTQEPELKDPVNFHYLRGPLAGGALPHGTADSVIAPERREAVEYRQDLELLLDIYLHGPLDSAYVSPYPVGTAMRQLTVDESGATVVLSRQFASLSGMDLTLACACMTITVMELTGADSVTIRSESPLSSGQESITMTREDLILFDSATSETT